MCFCLQFDWMVYFQRLLGNGELNINITHNDTVTFISKDTYFKPMFALIKNTSDRYLIIFLQAEELPQENHMF